MPRNATRGGAARSRGSAAFPHSMPRSTASCANVAARLASHILQREGDAHLPLSSKAAVPNLDDWRWPHLRTIRAQGHASPGHCADYFSLSNQVPKSTASTIEMFSARAKMAVVEPHARPATPPAAVAVRPRAGRLHVQPPALPEAARLPCQRRSTRSTRNASSFSHGERRSTALDILPARPRRGCRRTTRTSAARFVG